MSEQGRSVCSTQSGVVCDYCVSAGGCSGRHGGKTTSASTRLQDPSNPGDLQSCPHLFDSPLEAIYTDISSKQPRGTTDPTSVRLPSTPTSRRKPQTIGGPVTTDGDMK